jgi:tRNA C32,U32 (ribose-2'-O)-methylase TrmJ
MTLRQFGSIEEAIQVLREEEGCLIYASDLNPASKDVRDLKWDVDYEPSDSGAQSNNDNQSIQRPICVVMGNEDRGISNKMRELADETFYLPMCGFAESFNLSVATAIALAYMSAVSSRSAENGTVATGPLRPGDLDQHELQSLRLRGVLNSLAQKRMGKALLMKGE